MKTRMILISTILTSIAFLIPPITIDSSSKQMDNGSLIRSNSPSKKPTDGSNVVFFCNLSHIGRTDNIDAVSPTWVNITPSNIGVIADCIPDPWLPAEKMWAVSSTGIWKGERLNTVTPAWTLLQTTNQIRVATDGHTQNGSEPDRIIASMSIPDTVFVLYSHGGLGSTAKTWVGRSTDGGVTWSWNQAAPTGAQARDFGFAIPHNVVFPDQITVWVSPLREQIYKSIDGGKTFQQILSFPSTPSFYQLHAMYSPVRANDGSILYVGGGSSSQAVPLIYRTFNGGTSWTNITPIGGDSQPRSPIGKYEIAGTALSTTQLYALVQRPVDVQRENKKLYYSSNGGSSWSLRYDFANWEFDVVGLGINVMNPNRLYVLHELESVNPNNLIFLSNDGGVNWIDKSGNWKSIIGAAPWQIGVAIWDTPIWKPSTGVKVVDENNNSVSGAEVYLNGAKVPGLTSSDGTIQVKGMWLDDKLIARVRVAEIGTVKGNHNQDSNQNWAYRVYLTSMDNPPDSFEVQDPTITQTLTIKRDNTLIGFNLVVSVEWDANQMYLDQLIQGFEKASEYFFDASDGQMLFERVNIYDNKQNWANADQRFYADNNKWPFAPLGGINSRSQAVDFGRLFGGEKKPPMSNKEEWNKFNAYRTLTHEFGHYGLYLWDSYLKRSSSPPFITDAYCISENLQPDIATLMDDHYISTEFSMRGTEFEGVLWSDLCLDTLQFQFVGKSDWETIVSIYRDTWRPARWNLKTPLDHGHVITGPHEIPVATWFVATKDDANTGVCSSSSIEENQPGLFVNLVKPPSRIIRQGITDENGKITVLGAREGDILLFYQGRYLQYKKPVTCPSGERKPNTESTRITLAPIPFSLYVSVVLGNLTNDIIITVRASAPLSAFPEVTLYQDGASSAIPVTMTYNSSSGLYSGTGNLDANLPQTGDVTVSATDTQGRVVEQIVGFAIFDVIQDQATMISSSDGQTELIIPANTLSASGRLSIIPDTEPGPPPKGLIRLGELYTIKGDTGITFTGAASLLMNYLDVVGTADHTNLDTARIHRWSGSQWVAQSSYVSKTRHYVSASINQFGTYAIMAEFQEKIHLPFIRRNN